MNTAFVSDDNRIILTLDAGGTNFVFSAIQNGKFIVEDIILPSNSHNLELCLNSMVKGFQSVSELLPDAPSAISFAFPGPADYPNGIIGGYLPNFPSFREGVALGAFLRNKFGIPVFINNDADLYAYGEAIAGKLPEINRKLRDCGSTKIYKNLLGYTFGTGFGFGFVSNGRLHIGDNSCVETFCLRHKDMNSIIVEEGVSVRAIERLYGELAGNIGHPYSPKDIYEIAEGEKEGNREAAVMAFRKMGEIAGDAIATAATLIDGIIVIGGGITAAKKYIMPSLIHELRSSFSTITGEQVNRLQMKVYNLDNEEEFLAFSKGNSRRLKVFGSSGYVDYDSEKRIGICFSSVGASRAISLGAAMYALNSIDNNQSV